MLAMCWERGWRDAASLVAARHAPKPSPEHDKTDRDDERDVRTGHEAQRAHRQPPRGRLLGATLEQAAQSVCVPGCNPPSPVARSVL